MAKNIVICCDGTNNQFGKYNTNVVRMYQCLDLGAHTTQVAFYDPGVGTLAAPQLLTKVGQSLSKVGGMAIGVGIFPNVEEVIRYLMIHYQPGDRVYIFGFSRGAYTARMVAGLLRRLGLPRLGNENLFPYMKALYKVRDVKPGTSDDVSPDFRQTFGMPCPIHFLGLWDTVSTVGVIWNPDTFPYTFQNDEVTIVRHAIAVDERRGLFRTNRWGDPVPLAHLKGVAQDIAQLWFPGVHCDVGGGYAEGELWKRPFEWMIGEAKAAGLEILPARRDAILSGDREQWHRSEPLHNEANKPLWLALSVVPKQYRTKKNGVWKTRYRFSNARLRELRPGELLHRSVVERWRDVSTYRPVNLNPGIMNRLVPELAANTVALPYA